MNGNNFTTTDCLQYVDTKTNFEATVVTMICMSGIILSFTLVFHFYVYFYGPRSL